MNCIDVLQYAGPLEIWQVAARSQNTIANTLQELYTLAGSGRIRIDGVELAQIADLAKVLHPDDDVVALRHVQASIIGRARVSIAA